MKRPDLDLDPLDAEAWDIIRKDVDAAAASRPLETFASWLDEVGPPTRVRRRGIGVGGALAVGLLGAATLVLGALVLRSHLTARAPEPAPSIPQRVEPAAPAPAATIPTAIDPVPEPPPSRAAATGPIAGPVAAASPPTVELASAPRTTGRARKKDTRGAIDRDPRNATLRLTRARELEASGNPMGAVRHLDYLRTLATPDAQQALAAAARDPRLSPWLGHGWWSATADVRRSR